MSSKHTSKLEALPVNNAWPRLIILLLRDPHTLEGGKRRQNRSSNPHRVLTFWWGHNLNLDGSRSQGSNLLGHTLTDSGEHGGTSRKDNVGIKILTDIHITLHDSLEGRVGNTIHLQSGKVGLEQHLGTTEALISNHNNVSIGQFEGLFKGRRFGSLLHLFFKVDGDEAEGFLDVTDDFTFGSGGEGVSTLCQDLHEVIGEITSGKVETDNGVGEGISLVNGDSVGNTISRVEDTSSSTSRGIQRKHRLNIDIHGRNIKCLKHDLGHTFPVGLGVLRSLGQEDGVGLGGDTKFIVKGVVPDFFHVVPVGDNSVFDGVFEGEDSALGLGFVSDVGVSLFHTNHDTGLTSTSDKRGEHRSRSIISSESSFAHSRPIVNDKGSDIFFVSHDCK
mmetsp:Transcript_707/g.1130  ORF Transcript_707/g.1130 Transcript_707/m.1130 type:complete len:390 (+) Transcript_707:183-1352(+)